jgi:hypothetical protein
VVTLVPHRFFLVRDIDHSGTSGTGWVAQGVQFTDGVCVMRWMTDWHSTCTYDSIEDLIAIHGHGGDSHVEWIDR